jgi:hypothetical protein
MQTRRNKKKGRDEISPYQSVGRVHIGMGALSRARVLFEDLPCLHYLISLLYTRAPDDISQSKKESERRQPTRPAAWAIRDSCCDHPPSRREKNAMNIKQINKHTQPRIWEWVYSVSGWDARKIFLFCSIYLADFVPHQTRTVAVFYFMKDLRGNHDVISFYDLHTLLSPP